MMAKHSKLLSQIVRRALSDTTNTSRMKARTATAVQYTGHVSVVQKNGKTNEQTSIKNNSSLINQSINQSINHSFIHSFNLVFLARDSIYAIARYMPSPVRLSVCPSVCPSHGWISQRWLKLGSCNLHHRVTP